jgi:NAD(P)-dependent dehydrogenase (short-subunit alcohol dehydrogenase family)
MDRAAATRRRLVAVTGAASGIGASIAHAFAKEGRQVALLDRDDAVHEVAAELGADHTAYLMDVSSEHSIREIAKRIDTDLGTVDVLVNNAGVALLGPARYYPTSDWDATIATNLRGAFLCSRIFGSAMVSRGWGRIINIASQNAIQGIAGHVAYSAAKAGMIGMTQVLVAEWAPHGVTVNCVSPTLVETPMSRSTWPAEARAHVIGKIPSGRIAAPDDVTSAVLYLSGDAAGMINGHNLLVDGGASVTFL